MRNEKRNRKLLDFKAPQRWLSSQAQVTVWASQYKPSQELKTEVKDREEERGEGGEKKTCKDTTCPLLCIKLPRGFI